MTVREPEILARTEGGLGRITLNRPKALNALTHDMVRHIDRALTAWELDRAVQAVLIDGAGERGLCAGGDIRAIYDAATSGEYEPAMSFWRDEYRLNARLARYEKPIVSIMSGLVMGGGVGISAHCRHRVVTETTALAMPEVGIGFVPDVGGTYLLSRAPGELGTHVALTGGRVGAADVILLGLADLFVPSYRLPALAGALHDCAVDLVAPLLASFAEEPPPGELAAARRWIDAVYAGDGVEAIRDNLAGRSEPTAKAALETLDRNSPTALKLALRALRRARELGDLGACLKMELRVAAACLAGHDMAEGIRAAVIDKDRNPRWWPRRIEDVTTEMVEAHFRPIRGPELDFEATPATPSGRGQSG